MQFILLARSQRGGAGETCTDRKREREKRALASGSENGSSAGVSDEKMWKKEEDLSK